MDAMEQIYKKYADTVYRFLYSKTHDHHVAEELTQETFYHAVKNISRYDGNCKISTWLCAIAKNQLLTYYRKNPSADELSDSQDFVLSAESEVLDQMAQNDILRKLHQLPEPYREIMYLRVLGSLSFKEIGDITGKSENWARTTFYRGKLKLREELKYDGK